MSYDIYGQHLRPGHCEVHPEVHQPYPCDLCLMESEKSHYEKMAEEGYHRAMERDYCQKMIAAFICDSFTTA